MVPTISNLANSIPGLASIPYVFGSAALLTAVSRVTVSHPIDITLTGAGTVALTLSHLFTKKESKKVSINMADIEKKFDALVKKAVADASEQFHKVVEDAINADGVNVDVPKASDVVSDVTGPTGTTGGTGATGPFSPGPTGTSTSLTPATGSTTGTEAAPPAPAQSSSTPTKSVDVSELLNLLRLELTGSNISTVINWLQDHKLI